MLIINIFLDIFISSFNFSHFFQSTIGPYVKNIIKANKHKHGTFNSLNYKNCHFSI